MKVVITESRRDRLAKQELDKAFSNLYVEKKYVRDSTGSHGTINYINDDGVILLYGSRSNALYICEDVVKPIIYFGYTPQESKNVVGEWFSEKFELPVKIVQHVNKSVLN